MTIAAADASVVHLALQEGTVFVHFAIDLAVGMIKRFGQQRGQMAIQQGSVMVIAKQLRSAGMAARADFDFRLVAGWLLRKGVTSGRIDQPVLMTRLLKAGYQALGGIIY